MKMCKCGSFAINPHLYGRELGVDEHLCDVCYWRKRAMPSTGFVVASQHGHVTGIDAFFTTLQRAKAFIKYREGQFRIEKVGVNPK